MTLKEIHDIVKNIAQKSELSLMDIIELSKAIKGHLPTKPMYILELLRNGDRESHTYLVGVYNTYKEALNAAGFMMDGRSGKYCSEIHEFYPGDPNSLRLYRRYSKGDEE